ncbi:acyltransferase, partial [Acinetobacter pittii]
MARYESLDWLRGLMALTIMTYHLVSWQFFHPKAGNILGNFGIYGVSIFFVLSGLSMALAYHHFIKDIKSYTSFFIRRIFRIWPLLWLAIILISIENFRLYAELDCWKIFINLTTLFGFLSPTEYINVGAWSIGNEIVYYSLTPILIILYNYKKILGNALVFFSILIGLYFSFYLLHSDVNLSNQWETYINPFNNLFLYYCGIALY